MRHRLIHLEELQRMSGKFLAQYHDQLERETLLLFQQPAVPHGDQMVGLLAHIVQRQGHRLHALNHARQMSLAEMLAQRAHILQFQRLGHLQAVVVKSEANLFFPFFDHCLIAHDLDP